MTLLVGTQHEEGKWWHVQGWTPRLSGCVVKGLQYRAGRFYKYPSGEPAIHAHWKAFGEAVSCVRIVFLDVLTEIPGDSTGAVSAVNLCWHHWLYVKDDQRPIWFSKLGPDGKWIQLLFSLSQTLPLSEVLLHSPCFSAPGSGRSMSKVSVRHSLSWPHSNSFTLLWCLHTVSAG